MPTPTSQVLIVTEDTELGMALGETLAACGVDAVAVPASDAIGRIALESPEFILTDLDLGSYDPLDLVRRACQVVGPERVMLVASEDSVDRATDASAVGVGW